MKASAFSKAPSRREVQPGARVTPSLAPTANLLDSTTLLSSWGRSGRSGSAMGRAQTGRSKSFGSMEGKEHQEAMARATTLGLKRAPRPDPVPDSEQASLEVPPTIPSRPKSAAATSRPGESSATGGGGEPEEGVGVGGTLLASLWAKTAQVLGVQEAEEEAATIPKPSPTPRIAPPTRIASPPLVTRPATLPSDSPLQTSSLRPSATRSNPRSRPATYVSVTDSDPSSVLHPEPITFHRPAPVHPRNHHSHVSRGGGAGRGRSPYDWLEASDGRGQVGDFVFGGAVGRGAGRGRGRGDIGGTVGGAARPASHLIASTPAMAYVQQTSSPQPQTTPLVAHQHPLTPYPLPSAPPALSYFPPQPPSSPFAPFTSQYTGPSYPPPQSTLHARTPSQPLGSGPFLGPHSSPYPLPPPPSLPTNTVGLQSGSRAPLTNTLYHSPQIPPPGSTTSPLSRPPLHPTPHPTSSKYIPTLYPSISNPPSAVLMSNPLTSPPKLKPLPAISAAKSNPPLKPTGNLPASLTAGLKKEVQSIEYLGLRRGFEIHTEIGGGGKGKEEEDEQRERGYELLPLPGGGTGEEVREDKEKQVGGQEEKESGESEGRTGQDGSPAHEVEDQLIVEESSREDMDPSAPPPALDIEDSLSESERQDLLPSRLSLLPLPTLDLSWSLPDSDLDGGLGVSFSPLERMPTPDGPLVEWYVSHADDEGLRYDDGDDGEGYDDDDGDAMSSAFDALSAFVADFGVPKVEGDPVQHGVRMNKWLKEQGMKSEEVVSSAGGLSLNEASLSASTTIYRPRTAPPSALIPVLSPLLSSTPSSSSLLEPTRPLHLRRISFDTSPIISASNVDVPDSPSSDTATISFDTVVNATITTVERLYAAPIVVGSVLDRPRPKGRLRDVSRVRVVESEESTSVEESDLSARGEDDGGEEAREGQRPTSTITATNALSNSAFFPTPPPSLPSPPPTPPTLPPPRPPLVRVSRGPLPTPPLPSLPPTPSPRLPPPIARDTSATDDLSNLFSNW